MASEEQQQKAQELVDTPGAIEEIMPAIFAVKGSMRKHLVCFPPTEVTRAAGVFPASCTCEAHRLCYHLIAVQAVLRAREQQDEHVTL